MLLLLLLYIIALVSVIVYETLMKVCTAHRRGLDKDTVNFMLGTVGHFGPKP